MSERTGQEGRPSRRPLILAAVLAGGWLTALAILAVLSGNEPLVSREQLDRATLIVVAENSGNGVWKISDTLKGTPPDPPSVTLVEGPDVASAVLPLSPAGADRYEVTPVPLDAKGRVARPIYPTRPAVEAAVRELLAGK